MMNQMHRACMEACNACAISCLQCVAACLKETDVKSMASCIALDLECAEICRLCVSSMAREGACMKQHRHYKLPYKLCAFDSSFEYSCKNYF